MGGTRVVREEPGKQKPRSAPFASRLRDCGRGNSPEAAPKQMRGGKGTNALRQFKQSGRGGATPQREEEGRKIVGGARQVESRRAGVEHDQAG